MLAIFVMMCGCITEVSAIDRPKPQVTFRVDDTNVMLLVKSSAMSYAGRKSGGKSVTLFWSGSVKENGTVILLEPAASHSYEVMLEGVPGSHPELSVEFENWNNPSDTLRLQPPIGANGKVKIDLWFMVHNDMAFIVPDRSSHWLPPPRPENPGVQRMQSGAEKGKFLLFWKQPRVMGMNKEVTFDVRWSAKKISKEDWDSAVRIKDMKVMNGNSMDVTALIAAGARSFAVSAVDDRGQVSTMSDTVVVDIDAAGIPDVLKKP